MKKIKLTITEVLSLMKKILRGKNTIMKISSVKGRLVTVMAAVK